MDNIYEVDEQVEFKAIITDCRYYNDDTTWGVYQFATDENIPYYITSDDNKSNYGDCNYNKFSTLAGKMQELVIGGEYQIKATHKYDKKYGHQYVPISVFALIPQTKETQLLFLKSIIPESIAENLINAYPNIVNDVANGTIKEIDYSLVKGVREITWNRIKDKIVSNYLISDIIVMLKPLGVTYTMIKKLLSEEPNPALLKQEIEKNPYILTKINGLGFKRVDELALKMNPELIDSSERLIAYVKYFFTEMGENEGNTWCSTSFLKSGVSNYVPECIEKLEWLLSNKDFLHIEDDKVGLSYYYNMEMEIFNLIKDKMVRECTSEMPECIIEKAISEAEKEQGFTYTSEQLITIKKALRSNIVIICGKAGTGKSSIMRAIIKAYQLSNNVIVASALSAMAAQRITDNIFKLGAKVMQIVNDYDKNVFNGEIGYITKIDMSYENKKPEKYCVVTFNTPDGMRKSITYTKKELIYLDLAYALTVHKLQGSGRKTVIGIVDNTHYQLLDNCMLYTLLTRAKKRCLLLAEPQAFMKCIRTSHNKRNTWISIENNNM